MRRKPWWRGALRPNQSTQKIYDDCEDGLEMLFVPRHELASSQFMYLCSNLCKHGFVRPQRHQIFVAEKAENQPYVWCQKRDNSTHTNLQSSKSFGQNFRPGRQFLFPFSRFTLWPTVLRCHHHLFLWLRFVVHITCCSCCTHNLLCLGGERAAAAGPELPAAGGHIWGARVQQ